MKRGFENSFKVAGDQGCQDGCFALADPCEEPERCCEYAQALLDDCLERRSKDKRRRLMNLVTKFSIAGCGIVLVASLKAIGMAIVTLF